MQHSVCCRVELQFLDHSLVCLATDGQVHNIHVRRIDHLTQLSSRNGECDCLGQTILTFLLTIEVTGNETLLAELLCGFLASSGTLLATYANFFHNCVTLN